MPKEDLKIVQSLMRGLYGLEMAVERGGIKPADLAEKLEINRSSAYRLLFTLGEMGYLRQDKDTKKFVPNHAKYLTLMRSTDSWIKVGFNYLKILCEETGETANLAILDNNSVLFIGQELTNETVLSVNTPAGTRKAIYACALGKAILAFLDDEARDKILNKVEMKKYTPNTITNRDMLLSMLKEIRAAKYAVDAEETSEGVRCIAAPIFDRNDKPFAAIGISGPVSRISMQQIPVLAEAVVRVANELSKAIKYYM